MQNCPYSTFTVMCWVPRSRVCMLDIIRSNTALGSLVWSPDFYDSNTYYAPLLCFSGYTQQSISQSLKQFTIILQNTCILIQSSVSRFPILKYLHSIQNQFKVFIEARFLFLHHPASGQNKAPQLYEIFLASQENVQLLQ